MLLSFRKLGRSISAVLKKDWTSGLLKEVLGPTYESLVDVQEDEKDESYFDAAASYG